MNEIAGAGTPESRRIDVFDLGRPVARSHVPEDGVMGDMQDPAAAAVSDLIAHRASSQVDGVQAKPTSAEPAAGSLGEQLYRVLKARFPETGFLDLPRSFGKNAQLRVTVPVDSDNLVIAVDAIPSGKQIKKQIGTLTVGLSGRIVGSVAGEDSEVFATRLLAYLTAGKGTKLAQNGSANAENGTGWLERLLEPLDRLFARVFGG